MSGEPCWTGVRPIWVVTVDEAGQYHLPAGANYRDAGMPCRELGERADLGDDAVALEHRAVVNLAPVAPIDRFDNDRDAADDAGRHVFSPQPDWLSTLWQVSCRRAAFRVR